MFFVPFLLSSYSLTECSLYCYVLVQLSKALKSASTSYITYHQLQSDFKKTLKNVFSRNLKGSRQFRQFRRLVIFCFSHTFRQLTYHLCEALTKILIEISFQTLKSINFNSFSYQRASTFLFFCLFQIKDKKFLKEEKMLQQKLKQ